MHFLVLATLLWGTSFIAGKYAEGFASAEMIVLLRMLIAGLFVAYVAINTLQKLKKELVLKIFFVALLTYPVTFTLQFVGLRYTTASNAATMIGFGPLLVMLSGHLFFNQKATVVQLALSVVALLGVMMVMGKPDLSNDNYIGCAIVLSSTFAVAVWLQLAKSLMTMVPKGSYTALTIFCGAIINIPFALLINNDWQLHFSTQGMLAVIYLGVGCSLMAGWAWNKGLETTNPNLSGLFLALEPVFGVLFAIMLLGERPSSVAAIGIVLVILSVFGSLSQTKNQTTK